MNVNIVSNGNGQPDQNTINPFIVPSRNSVITAALDRMIARNKTFDYWTYRHCVAPDPAVGKTFEDLCEEMLRHINAELLATAQSVQKAIKASYKPLDVLPPSALAKMIASLNGNGLQYCLMPSLDAKGGEIRGYLVAPQYDENGIYTGVYDTFSPKSEEDTLMALIKPAYMSVSNPLHMCRQVKTLLLSELKAHHKTVMFRNVEWLCNDPAGVFDFRDGTYTEYTDPTFDAKYGNIIFLHHRHFFAYNPNAPQPSRVLPDGSVLTPERMQAMHFGTDAEGILKTEATRQKYLFTSCCHVAGQGDVFSFNNHRSEHGGSGKSVEGAIYEGMITGPKGTKIKKADGFEPILRVLLEDLGENFEMPAPDDAQLWISSEKRSDRKISAEAEWKSLCRKEPLRIRMMRQEAWYFSFDRCNNIACRQGAQEFAWHDAASKDMMHCISMNKRIRSTQQEDTGLADWVRTEEFQAYYFNLCLETCTQNGVLADNYSHDVLEMFKKELTDIDGSTGSYENVVGQIMEHFYELDIDALYAFFRAVCDVDGITRGRMPSKHDVMRYAETYASSTDRCRILRAKTGAFGKKTLDWIKKANERERTKDWLLRYHAHLESDLVVQTNTGYKLSMSYYIKEKGEPVEDGDFAYKNYKMRKYADGWAIRRNDINVAEFGKLVERENAEQFDDDGNLIED